MIIENPSNIDEILKGNNILLFFTSQSCGPCQEVKLVVKQIAQKYNELQIVIIDVTQNQKLSLKFRVLSIPALLFVKQGKEVKRITGYQSSAKIEKELQGFLERL
jgi:thioredoxin 1